MRVMDKPKIHWTRDLNEPVMATERVTAAGAGSLPQNYHITTPH